MRVILGKALHVIENIINKSQQLYESRTFGSKGPKKKKKTAQNLSIERHLLIHTKHGCSRGSSSISKTQSPPPLLILLLWQPVTQEVLNELCLLVLPLSDPPSIVPELVCVTKRSIVGLRDHMADEIIGCFQIYKKTLWLPSQCVCLSVCLSLFPFLQLFTVGEASCHVVNSSMESPPCKN